MRINYRIDTGLRVPQGVAYRNNRLAVAATGDHQLLLYDTAALPGAPGTPVGRQGTSAAAEGLLFPSALCFTSDTELVVADTQNKHLDRYQLAGGTWSWQGAITLAGLNPTVGFLVDVIPDGAGAVLLLDATNKRILRVTIPGGAVAVHHSDSIWGDPCAMASGGGYLWVVDAIRHQLFRYTAAFARTTHSGFGKANGQLRAPRGISFDAGSGQVVVAEGDNARLSVFDATGAFVESFDLPHGMVHEPYKVTMGKPGELFVADAAADAVYSIDMISQGARPVMRTAVEFGAVGVGYRLPQPLTIRNAGSVALNLTAITPKGTGFTLSGVPPFPVAVSPGAAVNVTVAFAPAAEGAHIGEVKVESDAPEHPAIFTNLRGEGFQPTPIALGLVPDTSGSMAQSSGSMSKIERLRSSSELFLDMLRVDAADELTLVSFASNANVRLGISSLTSAALANAHTIVSALAPGGSTSIGAGLLAGLGQLGSATNTLRSIIVLSDGIENTPPMIAAVRVPADVRVFTIGFGLPQYLDAPKLQGLATLHGGYFQITDGADHLLPKFFTQITADVFSQQIAIDPVFDMTHGQRWDLNQHVSS